MCMGDQAFRRFVGAEEWITMMEDVPEFVTGVLRYPFDETKTLFAYD